MLKHKIQYIGLIRKLRLLHHGHSTNVLLFVHHLIEEQVLHELLSKHRPLVLCFRGDNEIRTRDPLLARQVLSQLSYTPIIPGVHLCSHIVTNVVFSADQVLTVVFGMGTGVTPDRINTR